MKNLLLLLILTACLGCIGKTQKKSDQNGSPPQTINTVSLPEKYDSQKNDTAPDDQDIIRHDSRQVDTMINDFKIRYLTQDNDDFVVYENQALDLRYIYADQSVFFDISYKDLPIVNNLEINKDILFTKANIDSNYKEFQLSGCWIVNASQNDVSFKVFVCVPDSDYCYYFNLIFHSNGEYEINLHEIT